MRSNMRNRLYLMGVIIALGVFAGILAVCPAGESEAEKPSGNSKCYVCHPGMKTEDIKVEVEDGVLTLQGEKKRHEETEKANRYRVERVYGTFTRRFSLPMAVDASKVSATYKDGVLELVLPKADEAKPRRIEIQAA